MVLLVLGLSFTLLYSLQTQRRNECELNYYHILPHRPLSNVETIPYFWEWNQIAIEGTLVFYPIHPIHP
jgi:hypothetical protein